MCGVDSKRDVERAERIIEKIGEFDFSE